MASTSEIVKKLNLHPHPEGASTQKPSETNLCFSPLLTFLLDVLELNEADGQFKLTCLVSDLIGGEKPQYTVPPNVWFGAFPTKDYDISPEGSVVKVAPRDHESHYWLVGCTCAPAFQFEDFELAQRSKLVSFFPKHVPLISLFTLS